MHRSIAFGFLPYNRSSHVHESPAPTSSETQRRAAVARILGAFDGRLPARAALGTIQIRSAGWLCPLFEGCGLGSDRAREIEIQADTPVRLGALSGHSDADLARAASAAGFRALATGFPSGRKLGTQRSQFRFCLARRPDSVHAVVIGTGRTRHHETRSGNRPRNSAMARARRTAADSRHGYRV